MKKEKASRHFRFSRISLLKLWSFFLCLISPIPFPMKFQMHVKLILIPLIPLGLMAQGETNEEGFKTSTVSDYLSAKYKWEKLQAETKEAELQNDTPLKSAQQKEAESQASIEALIIERNREDRRRAGSDITEEEEGLDTVELKEHRVSELFSPLMRMSEIKNLEVIDPASGGRYLTESYYTDFENNILNRWTIPLIGRSQEEARQRRVPASAISGIFGRGGENAGASRQPGPRVRQTSPQGVQRNPAPIQRERKKRPPLREPRGRILGLEGIKCGSCPPDEFRHEFLSNGGRGSPSPEPIFPPTTLSQTYGPNL